MASKALLNDSTSVIVPTSKEENTSEGGAPKPLSSASSLSIEKAHAAAIHTIKARHLNPQKLVKKGESTPYIRFMERLSITLQKSKKTISYPSMYHTYIDSPASFNGGINPLQILIVSVHSYENELENEMIADTIKALSNKYNGKVRIWLKDDDKELSLNPNDKEITASLTGIINLEFYIEANSKAVLGEIKEAFESRAENFDNTKALMTIKTSSAEKSSEKTLENLKRQLDDSDAFKVEPHNYRNLTLLDKKSLAYKIFLDLPHETDPSKVLEVIFSTLSGKSYNKDKLLKAAEAFSFFYPSHNFTPQQILTLTLANPANKFMTMSELTQLCKELEIDLSSSEVRSEILAEAKEYRCIKLVEFSEDVPENTNFNFLWVNLDPQNDSAQNIFGKGVNSLNDSEFLWNEEKYEQAKQTYLEETVKIIKEQKEDFDSNDPQAVEDTFLFKVKKWMKTIPDATFNLWYDSALVTEKARKNTFETIQKISNSTGVELHLRDIHTLNISEKYEELKKTLQPKIPVYWRVDLLKELIIHHQLKNAISQISAVVDVDITPLTKEELFDKSTLKKLNEKGGVFVTRSNMHIENSFYMINRDHKEIMTSHDKIVFDKILKKLDNPDFDRDLYDYLRVKLNSEGVYKLYCYWVHVTDRPLKLMNMPNSQFNSGGRWRNDKFDHRNETFLPDYDGSIETEGGRAISGSGIFSSEFADFEYKPLPPLEES